MSDCTDCRHYEGNFREVPCGEEHDLYGPWRCDYARKYFSSRYGCQGVACRDFESIHFYNQDQELKRIRKEYSDWLEKNDDQNDEDRKISHQSATGASTGAISAAFAMLFVYGVRLVKVILGLAMVVGICGSILWAFTKDEIERIEYAFEDVQWESMPNGDMRLNVYFDVSPHVWYDKEDIFNTVRKKLKSHNYTASARKYNKKRGFVIKRDPIDDKFIKAYYDHEKDIIYLFSDNAITKERKQWIKENKNIEEIVEEIK